MTPAIHDVIAQAIAALEEAKATHYDCEDYIENDEGAGWSCNKGVREEHCLCLDWIHGIQKASSALAALGSLAPAPADQSDAGRNAVIEAAIMEERLACARLAGAWPTMPYGTFDERLKVTHALIDVCSAIRNRSSTNIIETDATETINSELAKFAAEFEEFVTSDDEYGDQEFGQFCQKNYGLILAALRSASGVSNHPSIDNLALTDLDLADPATRHVRLAELKCEEPSLGRTMDDARRALTAAPAETVGHGEDKPHLDAVRDLAVGVVDCAHGYTMEFAPSPAAHRAGYDAMEENLRIASNTLRITFAKDALPAADREAIRDAMKEARTWIDDSPIRCTSAKAMVANLTAALALIGEG